MSQVINLMQQFLERANSLVGGVHGSDAKDVKDAKNANTLKASSFHTKVRESHAKLAAKKAESRPDVKPTVHDEPKHVHDLNGKRAHHAPSPRNSEEPAEKSGRPNNPERMDKTSRSGKSEPRISGNSKNQVQSKDQVPTQDKVPTPVSADKGNLQSTSADGQPQVAAQSIEAETALRNRLEEMGVMATDEQLADPEFLNDMLQYLQSILPGLPKEVQTQAQPTTEILASTPGETQNMPLSVPAASPVVTEEEPVIQVPEEMNSTGVKGEPEPAPKELGNLIKERIAEINRNNGIEAGNNPQLTSESASIQNNQNLRGIRTGRSEDALEPTAIPAADLDRLRVMQNLAVQSDSKIESLSEVPAGDEGSDQHEISALSPNVAAGKPGTKGNQDPGTDSFGQQASHSQNAEAPVSGDASRSAKDGITGSQFNHTLDQIRSNESKTGVERAWAPQPTAFDQGLLQQISKKLSAVTHLGGGEISIQLEPENLGKIRVGMGMKDGAMTAHIGVESEKIRELIQANLSSLRDTLQNQGIQLQSLQVSVEQQPSSLFNPNGSNSQTFFHGRGQAGNDSLREGADVANLEIAPESDTGRRWGYNTMEYIG